MPVLDYVNGIAQGSCDVCGEGRSAPIPLDGTTDLWRCEDCLERYIEELDRRDEPDDGPDEYDEDARDPSEEEAYNEIETLSVSDDHTPSDPRLVLPVIPGRDSRMVSVEQELGAGGRELAKRLHEAGYSPFDRMTDYHSGLDGFCYVESDSSCDSEVIYSKLDLSNKGTARKLEGALMIVRDAIEAGESRLDMRCGFHVHVDAKGYSMENVQSLYHLWNHLEDTVFRLAAANWRDHRTSIASENYSPQTRKGIRTRSELGSYFDGNRAALNFSNFLRSRGDCRCGSFAFESWSDCTCDLHKSTIEFRVFNTTANLRKVHAYTALSLALVEHARRNVFTVETHPTCDYTRTNEVIDNEGTEAALKVIFQQLPLTDSEREDLVYCVEHSSLSGFANTLVMPDANQTELFENARTRDDNGRFAREAV